MNTQGTIFWRVVYDCLVQLQNKKPADAQRIIKEFRLRLQSAPADINADLVFHDEPFALARRLTGDERLTPDKAELSTYRKILQQQKKEAAALGTDQEVTLLATGSN